MNMSEHSLNEKQNKLFCSKMGCAIFKPQLYVDRLPDLPGMPDLTREELHKEIERSEISQDFLLYLSYDMDLKTESLRQAIRKCVKRGSVVTLRYLAYLLPKNATFSRRLKVKGLNMPVDPSCNDYSYKDYQMLTALLDDIELLKAYLDLLIIAVSKQEFHSTVFQMYNYHPNEILLQYLRRYCTDATLLYDQLKRYRRDPLIFTLNELSKDPQFIAWLTQNGPYHNRMGIYVNLIRYFLSSTDINFTYYAVNTHFDRRSLLDILIEEGYLTQSELLGYLLDNPHDAKYLSPFDRESIGYK